MSSPVEDVLTRYKDGLAELEMAEPFSPEKLLTVLLIRDEVQAAITSSPSAEATTLIAISRSDQVLKQWAESVQQIVVLENWRLSYQPKPEAWWWFLDVAQTEKAESAISRYEDEIATLENSDPATIQKQTEQWVIDVLIQVLNRRDAIQMDLQGQTLTPSELARVVALDQRLRAYIDQLPKILRPNVLRSLTNRLDDVREVLQPADEAWWWRLPIPIRWWDRFDLAWNTLTFLWLTATFSLLTDITSRFFIAAGPGLFGAFSITFQSILALAAGGALTKPGKLAVERTLRNCGFPKRTWQLAKFIAASLLLGVFVGFRLSLPRLARVYVNQGTQDYAAGQLNSAESQYLRAISLNPDNILAHYSLGAVYERLGKLDAAREKYSTAVAGGLDLAHYKLARLDILAENYNSAADLLFEGLRLAEDNVARYDIFSDLGWLRWEQTYYEEAKEHLEAAIALEQQIDQRYWKPSVHCLMAKTLEALDEGQTAIPFWENCLAYPKGESHPREDEWIYEAKQRLDL